MRVPVLRDRPWKARPVLVAQDTDRLTPAAPEAPNSLGPFLGLDLQATSWPLDTLAMLRDGQVHYAARHPDASALKRAVFFAAVEALDAQYAPEEGSQEASGARAGGMFTLALWQLQRTHPKLTLEVLAQRPELARRDPAVAAMLRPEDTSWGAHLNASRARLGLGLASAMARAQGWGGVELLQAQSPQDTLGLMQPAAWMAGQDPAQWVWSGTWLKAAEAAGWVPSEQPALGPLVLEYWLERHPQVTSQVAATLPLGLQAQQARVFAHPKGRALVWMMQWKTPHWANEAKRLFESMAGTYEVQGQRMQVHASGLMTALVVRPTSASWLAPPQMNALFDTRVRYPTSNRFALTYSAPLLDRLLSGAEHSTLQEGTWRDPDVGLSADVSALGQGWKVQKNTKGGLRWYARADDGMIQLSLEVFDPLGPAWGSPQSIDPIVQNLLGALPQGALVSKKAIKHPIGEGVEMVFTSKAQGVASTWSVWILEYNGALVTLSASSTTPSHGVVSQLAARVLQGLKGVDSKSSETSGHINIQVDP